MTAYSPDPRDLASRAARRGRRGPVRAARPVLALGRVPAAPRSRCRRDHGRPLRRRHGRGRPGRGAPPADGARLAVGRSRPGPTWPACATSWTAWSAAARQALERYGLGDVLGDIRRELDEIVAEERSGVERRLDEASRADADASDASLREMLRDVAARRLDQLDGLPADVGERLRSPPGLRLPGAGRARPVRGARGAASRPDARPVRGRHVRGDPLDAPRGPRRQPRDGARPQRAHPRADRRRRPGRPRVPRQARPVLPGRRARSTTSSTSSPRGWPRCSRCCARCRPSSAPSSNR